MIKNKKITNAKAWEKLFEDYNILSKIEDEGQFNISSQEIKDKTSKEPRLMAKFDHVKNLPPVFQDNKLCILPVASRGYVISHFDAYHDLEINDSPIKRFSLPPHLKSLDINKITSESIALNCAFASGIISDFLEDQEIIPTVAGRMTSGNFGFSIGSIVKKDTMLNVEVNNSQIEIDAAYEGIESLALIEAKLDLSDDFLVRQLYYPYRVWEKNMEGKPVRTLFLLYSNGIYQIYEYSFNDLNNYSSINLVKMKRYSLELDEITAEDIQGVLEDVDEKSEPEIAFPQANSFERVINICELLNVRSLSRKEITKRYDFDIRQTNYYTDAAIYLGLIEKVKTKKKPLSYKLTDKGSSILKKKYKERQLDLCRTILSHKPFADTLNSYFNTGVMPNKNDIINIMKIGNIYNIESEQTYKRRSSTIQSWVNWIIGLIKESDL